MKYCISRAITIVAAGALFLTGGLAGADEVGSTYGDATSAPDGTSSSTVSDTWSPGPENSSLSVAAGKPTAGTFDTIAEDPHLSGAEVSVHGCWKLGLNGSKLKGRKATVRVWLQVKSGGKWKTISSGKNDVYPGCGGAKRTKARFTCKGPQSNLFRNMVDVDVHGVIDGPARAYNTKTLSCTV